MHKPRGFLGYTKRAMHFQELTPFLQLTSIQSAGSHFYSEIGESSKIVPTLTQNWRRQSRHFQRFCVLM